MKVITVASDLSNKGFTDFLQPSCDYYKLDATVLEYDEDVFYSNRLKDVLLSSYLKSVDNDQIIFFTDATDTVFVAGQDEMLKKFELFNAPMVFSAEINCWPDRALEIEYPSTDIHFKYLNSGGFIALAGYLKYIYQTYPIFETGTDESLLWSNQYYWNLIYKAESKNIKIDHNCEIFYNTAVLVEDRTIHKQELSDPLSFNYLLQSERCRLDTELKFMNGRVKSTITNTYPCHIHFPGRISKALMRSGYFDGIKPLECNKNND